LTGSALGYALAVLCAMVTGIAFIAAKPVLGYLDPLSFSISQFGLASVFSFAWLLAHRNVSDLRRVTPGQWTFLVVVSLLFLGAVYTTWIAISLIPVTSASLLSRLEVLFTVFLGMAFLGDRFTRRETMGAIVMLLGVVVIRYQAPPSFSAGFWMIVLASALFGVTEVLVKTRVHSIPPDVFTFARNGLVFAFFTLAALWRLVMREHAGWSGFVDWEGIRRGFPLIVIAALVGPFLARTLYMYSLRHLAVSRAALIGQSQPLFVAIYSSILLHALPSRREWMGGLFILGGALLLVRWRRGLSWWRTLRGQGDSEPGEVLP
jgi:drug/metabolite transporter (DMT)-like permease